jgi:hypothetical protein
MEWTLDKLICKIQNDLELHAENFVTRPEIISFIKNRRHAKPTVFTIDSDGGDPDLAETGTRLRAQFCKNGIPAYPSARRAAKALFHLCQYHARF